MSEGDKKELNFNFSNEEANTIIEALGYLPFKRVYKLIEKIHLQANSNMKIDKTE